MCTGLHVKYPLLLSDFNETRIFSTDFSEYPQISDFIKIRQLGADGQTDMKNSVVALRSFVNGARNDVEDISKLCYIL